MCRRGGFPREYGRVVRRMVPLIACSLLPWIFQPAVCSCWQVSNLGRVKNTRGQISLGCLHPSGYRMVHLTHESRQRVFSVHLLVAFAFLGPPSSPLLVVHHVDANRCNNSLQNLEYATRSENSRYSLNNPNKERGRRKRAVMARPCGTATWKTYSSMQQAADVVGVHVNSVGRCCRGRACSCRGHEFRSVPDADLPGEYWVDAICPKTRCTLPGYRISSCGQMEGPSGVILHGSYRDGYRYIRHKGRNLQLHRVLACSFLEVPADSTSWEVNHKDGNPSNNCIENIEVATRSENMLHAWQMRTHRRVPSTRRPVEARPLLTGVYCTFASVIEAAERLGLSAGNIVKCCKDRLKSCGGYEWQYLQAGNMEMRSGEIWREVDVSGLLAAWDVNRTPNSLDSAAIGLCSEKGYMREVLLDDRSRGSP